MRFATYAVHIIAGSLGIISGFVALYAVKGGGIHRKSGRVFVYAMVTMALFGAFMAAVYGKAPGANVPVGFLTAYLVFTALTTVQPTRIASRWADVGVMLVPAGVCVALLAFALRAFNSPTGTLYGMPPLPFLIFTAIGLLAIAGDLRMIGAGGSRALHGRPRLKRHLWRMTTALLIAAFSFFLGQAKVIPKPIRIYPLLLIPPLVVLGTLVYWLWRMRGRRSAASVRERSPEIRLVAERV